MPHSVLRRYTPPTCTLEIMAKNSPLSRWAGQPVLKHLRFQLSLDDPKLPPEQWVTLRGNRTQLEALSETVTTYVQWLLQAHSPVKASIGEASIAVLPAPSSIALQTAPLATGITLQPKGLLAHELVLGSLAPEKSALTVTLSTLQLFDLANALEEYAADVVSLPTLPRSSWLKSSPWGQVAAISLVMVGLSASMVKLLDSRQNTPTAVTTSQGASSSDQRIAALPPPTAIESPALSNQTLPPPPPLGSTVPASPGLPTVTLPQSSSAPGQTARTIVARPTPTRKTQTTTSTAASNLRLRQPGQPIVQPNVVASAPTATSLTAAQKSAGVTSDRAETDTPFDTIPQVAEARHYFEQRWNPPQGLTQTLEYRLIVGPDGTIQRIEPLGQMAGDYVDRTGIPLVGEPLTSALEKGRSAKIRLVLSPDGKVQTFLEGQ